MTKKQTTTQSQPVLPVEDFEFFMSHALGGGLQNPEVTEADKKRFADISSRNVSVADALNIALVASQQIVQNGMGELFNIVSNALDSVNVMAIALKEAGVITQEDLEKAGEKFNKEIAEQEALIAKQMQEQAKDEEEIELTAEPKDTKGMKVVRNESEVDASVKGK